jgi:hypothetical protein
VRVLDGDRVTRAGGGEALSSSETSVLTRAHGVTSQKMTFFIVTAVKTSNLT